MSNKKKRQPGSYRAPAKAAPEPRRGLLDSILAPRPPGGSPMPKLRRTLARGTVTVASTPILVLAVPIVLLVLWVLLVAAGFLGPFALLGFTLSVPPVTSLADTEIAGRTFAGTGVAAGLLGTFGFILLHAVMNGLIATISVETLRTGSVTIWALRRAPRVLLVTVATGMIGLSLLILGNIVAIFLGSAGAIFGLIGSLVLGVYLFAFAPAIAADEDRRLSDALSRSIRAARMPGSANLWLAVAYVFLVYLWLALTQSQALPGATIDAVPSAGAWAAVILLNLAQVILQATFAYRYLAVADQVPEAPPRQARAAR
jgi:hypothetical protein